MGLLATALLFAAGAAEASGPLDQREEPLPPTNVLLRADLSTVPTFGYQLASGRGFDGNDYSTDTSLLLFGGELGLNLGYSPKPAVRYGVRGSALLAPRLAGGQGLNYTGIDGLAAFSVGPTVGLRNLLAEPVELEFELAFSSLNWLGQQAAIGAPDNIYEIQASQYGVRAGARLIWHPLGWGSPLGVLAGLDGRFGYAGRAGVSNVGGVVCGHAGISLGF